MNRYRLSLLVLLTLLGGEERLMAQTAKSAPHILLPLDTGIVPSAELLLQELDIYLNADRSDNFQRNKQGIHHHLSLLKEYYHKEAEIHLSQLAIWSHSEHFLERLPSYFLDTLVEQGWHIHPEALGAALNKLETLMPTDPDDMIDCAAGKPMGQILRLLAYQKPKGLEDKIKRYEQSPDYDLAYAALCADLSLRHLPEPSYAKLVQKHWNVSSREDIEQLSPKQRSICSLITVDNGIRQGKLADWVDVPIIKYARDYLNELDMSDYAQVTQAFITKHKGKETIIGGLDFHNQCLIYSYLPPPKPAMKVAQILLSKAPKEQPKP